VPALLQERIFFLCHCHKERNKEKSRKERYTSRSFHFALIKLLYYCGFSICFSLIRKLIDTGDKGSRPLHHSTTKAQLKYHIGNGLYSFPIVFFCFFFGQAKKKRKMMNSTDSLSEQEQIASFLAMTVLPSSPNTYKKH
jgi:hypothetical protein